MITLARLDMVRKDSHATADELSSLQTQLNASFDRIQDALVAARGTTQLTVGPAGTAALLPSRPSGYIEIEISGARYVLPFYAKA